VDAPLALPIPERIDSENVLDVMAGLADACSRVAPAGPLALDFSALKAFDSSALSMLLELSRRRGSAVSVLNPPPKLAELAELYGVDELLFGKAPDAPAAR